jgi:hypothetical protein
MSNEFLSTVVDALRFSPDESADPSSKNRKKKALSEFSVREWSRQIGLLDRVGLTLPLYAKLLENDKCGSLPSQVLAALEQRRRDNTRRVNGMLSTFEQAVSALQQVGVRFVCVKGFSLVPEYLPELWQRHQIDFDLLVNAEDQLRAQEALEKLGYKLTAVDGAERRLRIPVSQPLPHNAYLYSAQEGASIELHTDFWETGKDDLRFRCPTMRFSIRFFTFFGIFLDRGHVCFGFTKLPPICTAIEMTMCCGKRCGISYTQMSAWRKLPLLCC